MALFNVISNTPMTNNLIEVFNNIIKQEITEFNILDIKKLFNAFIEYFRLKKIENLQMSKRIPIDDLMFKKAKDINEKDLITEYQEFYFINQKQEQKIEVDKCAEFINMKQGTSLKRLKRCTKIL
jgi:hypothetical protein